MIRMPRTTTAALAAGAIASAVILGTAGCTGTPTSVGTPTVSATHRPGTTSAASLQKWLKAGGEMPDRKPVASTNGTILNGMTHTTVAVTAQVLSVTSTPTTTELIWRLSTSDGSTVDMNSSQLSQLPWNDSRLVGLEVPATKAIYHPYTMVPPRTADGSASECVCSDVRSLGLDAAGMLMYASMPVLPAAVSTVTVTIPGFPDMPGVPVRGR